MSQVLIDILAETKDANKSIDKFAGNAEKQSKAISKAFRAVGVVAAGAVAVFAGRKVIGAINDSIRAANDYEDSLSGLNSALKLSGNFSESASRDFEKFATQIQRTTKFGDDAALSTLEVATNFGLSGERAKEFTRAAAELAQITGTSLENAARQLGQTLNGQAGTLGRNIAGFNQLTKAQLEAGEAIDFITDRFGGAALDATKTYSGAQDQLAKAQGDLSKQLGFLITQNPIIIKAVDLAAQTFAKAADFVEQNRDEVIAFVNRGLRLLIKVMSNTIRVFGFFVKGIENILKGQSIWINAVLELIEVLLSFELVEKTINIVGEAFRNTVSIFTGGIRDILNAVSRIPGVSKAFEAVGISIDDTVKSLDGLTTSLREPPETTAFESIRAGFDTIREVSSSTQDAVFGTFDAINKGVDKVAGFGDKVAGEFDKIASKSSIPDVDANVILDVDPKTGQVIGATNDVGDEIAQEELKKITKILGKELTPKEIGLQTGKVLSNVAQGRQGAENLVSGALSGVADFFLPGLGQALGPLIDTFIQGPDATRQFVEEFIEALPEVIVAFSESVPVFIEAMAENIDPFIRAMVEAAPRVVLALVSAQFKIWETLIRNLFREVGLDFDETLNQARQKLTAAFDKFVAKLEPVGRLFQQIGNFFKGIVSAFEGLIDRITSAGKSLDPSQAGGFLGNVVRGDFKGAGKALGFQSGLTEVPSGFPRDSFGPVGLTSGERVIDADTNRDLKDFLSQARSGGSNQPIIVTLQLGQEELARTILQLDQDGFQLRA